MNIQRIMRHRKERLEFAWNCVAIDRCGGWELAAQIVAIGVSKGLTIEDIASVTNIGPSVVRELYQYSLTRPRNNPPPDDENDISSWGI